MEFLIGYVLFMAATAILSIYNIWMPVYKSVKIAKPDSILIISPYISFITFFSMSALFAPVMFFAVISTSINEAFKHGLFEGLIEE